MKDPVTETEVRATTHQRMADHIAFQTELTLADCEEIVDAGLADMDDFGIHESDPSAYQYHGDRWEIDYGSGRPRLLERWEVPENRPGPATLRAQWAFAFMVYGLDGIGPPSTDEFVTRLREETWGSIFRRAAERDAAEAARDAGDPGEGGNREEVTDREEE